MPGKLAGRSLFDLWAWTCASLKRRGGGGGGRAGRVGDSPSLSVDGGWYSSSDESDERFLLDPSSSLCCLPCGRSGW